MKIAVAQTEIRAFDVAWNLKNILNAIASAKSQQAHVIVLPELCVSGYFIGDLWENRSFLKECEAAHDAIRQASSDIAVVFGSVGIDWQKQNEDGRVRKYNAAFVVQNQRFLVHPRTGYTFFVKTLLPLYRQFDDARYFYDGARLSLELNLPIEHLVCPVELSLGGFTETLGLTVCEDGWSENYGTSPIDILAKHHLCTTIVNLSASPYSQAKPQRRHENFSQLARQNECDILYVNAVGMQNTGKTIYGFDGGSALYLRDGSTSSLGDFFTAGMAFVTLENKRFQATPSTQSFISRDDEPFIALQHIVGHTLTQWNIQKVVIGLSGGIDSAVSACLFQTLLGAQNVLLVNMPSRYNSALTQNAARLLASNLGCAYGSVAIETSVQQTRQDLEALKKIPGFEALNLSSFVFENVQARDRGGRILAAIASALGAVFPCNANKTETTVGYSTLYGDATGFLAPLADLWKFEIYRLGRYFNERIYQTEVIPSAIFDVTPSAELSAEQDVMQHKGDPIVYRYHDFLFRSWVESWEHKSLVDVLESYRDKTLAAKIGIDTSVLNELFATPAAFVKDVERWWALYRGMGVVKRMQMPPLVGLSRRAFGTDYRESILPPHELASPAYQTLRAQILTKLPS